MWSIHVFAEGLFGERRKPMLKMDSTVVRQLPRSQVQTWFALSCERITMAHRHQSEGPTCWQSDTAVLLVRCPVISSATIRAGTVEPLKRWMYFVQVPLTPSPSSLHVAPPSSLSCNQVVLSARFSIATYSPLTLLPETSFQSFPA